MAEEATEVNGLYYWFIDTLHNDYLGIVMGAKLHLLSTYALDSGI